MNNKINNYLVLNYSKVLLNSILISFCLGLILNLFEEVEFFKNSGESLLLPITLTLSYIKTDKCLSMSCFKKLTCPSESLRHGTYVKFSPPAFRKISLFS